MVMDNVQFKESYYNLHGLTLDKLLEEISVEEIYDSPYSPILNGWFSVVTDLGIIAYFGNEAEAFRFRLDYINRILNT
jgi:hypothetical protein